MDYDDLEAKVGPNVDDAMPERLGPEWEPANRKTGLMNPPGSSAAVHVSDEKAKRLLRRGWTAAEPPAPAEDVFECDVCGFEAKSPAGLGAHQRRHKDE